MLERVSYRTAVMPQDKDAVTRPPRWCMHVMAGVIRMGRPRPGSGCIRSR